MALLRSLQLPVSSDVANDPFFGRAGKIMAASQRDQRLKFEILVPVISAAKPTAICSFNWHQDHFSGTFGIRSSDGEVASTACLGFGLERVTLALIKTHGFDPLQWPADARAALAGFTGAMTRFAVLPGLTASDHRPHPLHSPERIWVEKNCYADLWIELLHAMGMEPRACLSFVVALDFLGDQWTFFKPPLGDLRALYGIDVQELTVWRPLIEHACELLGSGRLLSVEVDAHWLPDTAGTDYRQSHTKTTIVLNAIDLEARRLGYFHNAGYFELHGVDFGQIFALDVPPPTLAPYAEIIHIDRACGHPDAELRARSAAKLDEHLAWRRASNPVARFRERFEADLPALQQRGLAGYHPWAFAGVRQLGAAFELASPYLRWLRPGAQAAAADFELIARHSKTLLLKAARAVNSGRALDAAELFDEMTSAWDRGMAAGVGVIRSARRA